MMLTNIMTSLRRTVKSGNPNAQRVLKRQFVHNTKDNKEEINQFSVQLKEIATFIAGSVALHSLHNHYENNIDNYSLKNLDHKIRQALEITIPSNFEEKSVADVQKSVVKSLDAVNFLQNYLNHARQVTSMLSPAFTMMPVLATPAFAATVVLSAVDAVNILSILRIKEMVEKRPDMIPESKKEDYAKLLHNVEKHIPKAIGFDALKIFYRGQLVAVNRKLKESEKPQSNYQFSVFKYLADNRLVTSKANIPITAWILPTSYFISDLAAKDTRDLTKDLTKLKDFFEDINAPCQNEKKTEELVKKLTQCEAKSKKE